MSHFSRPEIFELPLAPLRAGITDGHIILCELGRGHAGVGPYLSFHLVQRGLAPDPADGRLGGYSFQREISRGETLYAYRLLEDSLAGQGLLGERIMDMGEGELIGQAANAVCLAALQTQPEWLAEITPLLSEDEQRFLRAYTPGLAVSE